MTTQRKPSPLPQIKAGDIVSLPDMGSSTLALVMMDDYQQGEFKGIYYLPIRLMDRKSYRGKNVEGEVYHLSGKNHDEIRSATKRGDYRLSEKYICRLDFKIMHVAFDEERLPEVFFIKYASSEKTKFFNHAMREFNRILLAERGIVDHIVEETPHKILPRLKAPSQRELSRSSSATVKDISLDDAMTLSLSQNPYLSDVAYNTLIGISNTKLRPDTLRQAFELVRSLDMPDDRVDQKAKAAFCKSFKKHAEGEDWTLNEVFTNVREGWMAFMEQITDPHQYDFSDIKTDYPAHTRK